MDTNGFLNLSNRCPELQNILDSSFGFRFKWGTLLVILFILLSLSKTRTFMDKYIICKKYKDTIKKWAEGFHSKWYPQI